MNKRLLQISILLVVIALGTGGTVFYKKYLSGVKPALFNASSNIADLVEQGKPLSHSDEFELSIFAENLKSPRVLVFDPHGTLLVSLPGEGKVMALPDTNRDGKADRTVTVADGLNKPHGISFRTHDDRKIYIAETDGVRVFDYTPGQMKATNGRRLVQLPDGGRHFTRTILFLPPPQDNIMLISVGSSCDTCIEEDWRRAKILAYDMDSENLKVFASGLRNSVFMSIHPATKSIWATEMGRDFLGDNLPPDEINIIEKGKDYGWPYCYGKNIRDDAFRNDVTDRSICESKEPSFIDIQAHSAPLGLDFFPSSGWPEKYRHTLLVAYHGSWNRSTPTGYKVVWFHVDAEGRFLGKQDFITGWLQEDNTSLGRPVDVNITDNGTMYISDDKAGVIYLLSLKE